MTLTRRQVVIGALAANACAHVNDSTPHLSTFAAWLPRETANDVPFDPALLEGRVVLITFVNTWSFPCLADLVTLKKLEQDWGPRGFSNVLVGLDLEGRLVLDPFARGYQITYPVVVANDALRSGETPFGRIRETPSRLLFGRDGHLVVAFAGVAQYDDLERLVVAELDKHP